MKTAYEILIQGNYTCVLTDGVHTHTSALRGVRPLLELLDSGENVTGFSAADKVVGRAAAMIYCLLGIQDLHAVIISQGALEVLRQNGIRVIYGSLVSSIRNRTNTGPCPMEQATAGIDDPLEALAAVRDQLKALSGTP